MLLRLLPLPTPSQPSPPTILFTLPLPNHPYTAKSLPLPSNLLTHRALCIQEDLNIPNVLLGEKSSWIGGIIDDVTFSLVQSVVTIHLIDGTTVTLDLTASCEVQLNRVVEQVQLSFAAAAAPPPPAEPRTSTSSATSISSTSSIASASSVVSSVRRSSPSSLLFSLLSPLLPNTQAPPAVPPHVAAQQQPARAHRRQARSLLVDAYRRYILPELKSRLPPAYLPWIIQNEASRKLDEFNRLKEEILALLQLAGVRRPSASIAVSSMHRRSSSNMSSDHSSSESESDEDHEFVPSSPETSATSIMSSDVDDSSSSSKASSSHSPKAFLASIPPAHSIPIRHRPTYVMQVQRMTALTDRLQSIRTLGVRYEREEGKRRWLEGLELGRLADRSQRRAFSGGRLAATRLINAEPVKRSRLYQSWTAEDEVRLAKEKEAARLHPVMMETVSEVAFTSDVDDDDTCSITSSSSDSSDSSAVPSTPTTEMPPSPDSQVVIREEGEMHGVSSPFIRVFHPQPQDHLGLVLESPTLESKLHAKEVAENTPSSRELGLEYESALSTRSRISANLSLTRAANDVEAQMSVDGSNSPPRLPHLRLPRWDETINAPIGLTATVF